MIASQLKTSVMQMNSYTLIKVKQNYFREMKENHWILLKPYSKETKVHVIEMRDLLAQRNLDN